jgi:hypothetical protein
VQRRSGTSTDAVSAIKAARRLKGAPRRT